MFFCYVPNLRFSDEQWKSTTLGASCDGFDYGIGAEAIDFDGSNQYIRITDIDDEYSLYTSRHPVSPSFIDENCICKENDILFARTGASTGKTYLYNQSDGKLYFAGFLIRVNVKQSYDSYFIFTITKTNKYNNWVKIMSARSGQPGINAQEYKKLSFKHPSIETQRKISSFIKKIDTRILLQSKIIEDLEILKKWIINHHFSNNPNLDLGKIIVQISERNRINNVNRVLSVNNKYGFINQSEQFEDREVASNDRTNYKIVRKNDFAFNPARINVGSIAKLDNYDIGIVSPMYICFKCSTFNIDVDYLYYYFFSNAFKNELNKRLEGSVRQCLQYDALCNIKLYVSSLAKQIDFVVKIKALTKKLKIEKDILSLYKKQKAYLLQNMFI